MKKNVLGELSNTQINNYLNGYPQYRGCYSCLQLPKIQNGFYVINLDNFNLAGTHWVSVWMTTNKAYYIDPFGQVPNSQIEDWLVKSGRKLLYNDEQLQEIKSEACGYFACFFGIHLMSGFTVEQTLNCFSKNTKMNQQILKLFFKL